MVEKLEILKKNGQKLEFENIDTWEVKGGCVLAVWTDHSNNNAIFIPLADVDTYSQIKE